MGTIFLLSKCSVLDVSIFLMWSSQTHTCGLEPTNMLLKSFLMSPHAIFFSTVTIMKHHLGLCD